MKVSLLILTMLLFAACKQALEKAPEDKSEVTQRESAQSIYELEGEWIDQDSNKHLLKDFSGTVQVVAMVFTNCPYACPRIVGDLQAIEEEIPADKKDKVHFLLISFDTERDTVERLAQFATEMGLNKNWTLLHGNDEDVRNLSVILDVQYEKMDGGDFSHSNIITVLDPKGGIQFRQEGLGKAPDQVIKAIDQLLQ